MKIRTKDLAEKLIWILTVAWFSSFVLFERVSTGKYLLLGFAAVIFLLSAYLHGWRIHFTLTPWHGFIAVFMLFTFASSLWAMKAADAREKGNTLLQILLCFSLVYVHYIQDDGVERLISAVKWTGYAVTIYSFLAYGFDNMIDMISNETRLENTFSNVNTIGMLSAMAIVIQVYEISRKRKFHADALFCIPSIVMVAATQSRKALLFVVGGVFLVFLSKSFNNKDVIKVILRTLGAGLVCCLLLFAVLQLPIFAGILDRMEELLWMFTGRGSVGYSVKIRDQMVELGWRTFLENPIGGIGIGCPHILAGIHLNFDTYLHNNFVELLAGGGIIGFCLYYGMYVYLLVNMVRYRHYADQEYWLCLIMIVLLLIMDYGMVSYYTKSTYFYFMLLFLEVKKLKKRSRMYAFQSAFKKDLPVSDR